MKKQGIVLFVTAFFTVYGLINYVIYRWGLSALPDDPVVRTLYSTLFLFVAAAFIAGRFLERTSFLTAGEGLVWIGSFWLAAMLYLLLAIGALALAHAVAALAAPIADPLRIFLERENGPVTAFVVGIVVLLVAGGYVNALFPCVRTVELTISKQAQGVKRMVIAVATDIHLGTIIGRRRLGRIVRLLNGIDADLVLLPGDIVDEDLGPVIRDNLGEQLLGIRSRMGVIAVTGNHEYIGGAENAVRYLSDHGIRFLRDEVMSLPNGVQIVGREDRSRAQFAGKKRAPLEELMKGVRSEQPVILMDHQPFRLDEAERLGVDLQLSGHTHHGQLWPLNLVTKRVYEVSYGYLRKGATHVYVSNGVGTWGPPVRVGNRPEVIRIVLNFAS